MGKESKPSSSGRPVSGTSYKGARNVNTSSGSRQSGTAHVKIKK